MPASSNKDTHQVNNLLHALRGEQFRRAQNAKGSRAHLNFTSLSGASSSGNKGLPSLPKDISKLDYDTDPTEAFRSLRLTTNATATTHPWSPPLPPLSASARYAGPAPPKSWRHHTSTEQKTHETPEWRAEALSLILSHILPDPASPIPSSSSSRSRAGQSNEARVLPSLALVCLRRLRSLASDEDFAEMIVPHLPPHLRRDLMRDTAVHSPLPSPTLFSLCGKEGHVAGELIVIGPAASLTKDYFSRNPSLNQTKSLEQGKHQSDDWDAEGDTPELLNTFILMSTRLAPYTLLRLPATITNMALIHLPDPIPLHRLPVVCPLMETLDLSYNVWLVEGTKALDRVEWARWSHLRVLGFRGCYIPEGVIAKLNKGRWDDVQVVQ